MTELLTVELPLDPAPHPHRPESAGSALATVHDYSRSRPDPDLACDLAMIIADIGHLCADRGIDFAEILRNGVHDYTLARLEG